MENFILYSLSALFLVLALVVYFGKGDNLIAGYNTASEKERDDADIREVEWGQNEACPVGYHVNIPLKIAYSSAKI